MSQRTRMNPAQRKALILDTARSAFATHSYQNVSVAAVAATAGVSVALVHKYFDSKSGLFAAVLEQHFQQLRELQRHAVTGKASTRDRVVALVEAQLDYVVKLQRPHETQHVLFGHDDARASEVRRLDEHGFAQTLRDIVRPNDSARDFYAVAAFHGILQAATRTWVQRGCPEEEKWPIIEAVVGGLEGSLGDWNR